MQSFDARLRALIEKNEGRIHWLYSDTGGVATVGVGHAVFSADEACRLRFLHRDLTTRALPSEIAAEWSRARRIPIRPNDAGLAALFLLNEEITDLLYEDLARCAKRLNEEIPGFSGLPDDARLACFDMCFNLGSLHGYPRLLAAITARDWATATVESERHGIGVARNAEITKVVCGVRVSEIEVAANELLGLLESHFSRMRGEPVAFDDPKDLEDFLAADAALKRLRSAVDAAGCV